VSVAAFLNSASASSLRFVTRAIARDSFSASTSYGTFSICAKTFISGV